MKISKHEISVTYGTYFCDIKRKKKYNNIILQPVTNLLTSKKLNEAYFIYPLIIYLTFLSRHFKYNGNVSGNKTIFRLLTAIVLIK